MNHQSGACYSTEQLRAFLQPAGSNKAEQIDEPGQAVELHLEQCASCRERLESLSSENVDFSPMRDALLIPKVESHRLSAVMADLSSSSVGSTNVAERDFSFAEVKTWIKPDSRGRIGRFADYDLIECVGRGGMGIVFRAFDASLDRPVAVKLMLPALANDHEAKLRFFREARSIAAVRHPNVVAVHAVSEQDGLPFLVTEFVEGQSLQHWVRPHDPIDAETIRRMGADIAAGLDACHQAGVLHRDIKPSNVLVDSRNGTAKITDFGLAMVASSPSLTLPGQLAGTPGYLAPERLAGMATDERSDLFSLGCVLYALAAGVEPFQSDSPFATMHQISAHEPAALRSTNPRIPESLERVIQSLMSKRPDDRPQSAAEARELLLKPSLAIETQSFFQNGTRRLLLRGLLAISLVALCYVGFLLSRGHSPAVRPSDGRFVVSSADELADAIDAALTNDVIEIRSNELLETEGLVVAGKSITLKATEDFHPTIGLVASDDSLAPLLRIEDGEVTLVGLALEEQITDADEFQLVSVERGGVFADDCRFETGSPGCCIGFEGGTQSEFRDCRFMFFEGAGVRWETRDGDALLFQSCMHGGESAIGIFASGNASLRWLQSEALVTSSLIEFEADDGQLDVWVEGLRAQSEESVIVLYEPDISVDTFRRQFRWHGESNILFAPEIDEEEDEFAPWQNDVSLWATDDVGSKYDQPLIDDELDDALDELLAGESFDDVLDKKADD